MKDVIIVTADSLRADHCGWMSDLELTPNLDKISQESVSFTSAISPGPRTLSSVPVSHTGTYFPKTEHDITKHEERIARIQNHIQNNETISERFQNEGYTTIAFTANPWTSADDSFNKCFDKFREVSREGGFIRDLFSNTFISEPARFFDQWIHKDVYFSQWRTFYSEIVETINAIPGPVFTWIFLMDSHNPYLVPRQDRYESSTIGMYSSLIKANGSLGETNDGTTISSSISEKTIENLSAAYRDSVRSVDKFIGRLHDLISQDTVLIFHSDHGEAFGEHGSFGHTRSLYEENLHVPLLVYGIEERGQIDEIVSTKYLPDIAYSCSINRCLPNGLRNDDFVFSRTEDSNGIAIRGRRWKYISHEREELYDLSRDPNERISRCEDYPDLVQKFRSLMEEHILNLPEPEDEIGTVTSDEMRDHLESLGYLE